MYKQSTLLRHYIAWGVLSFIISLVVFYPYLNTYFASDDWRTILRNMDINWLEIPTWFIQLRVGWYRPMHDIFIAICWHFFGLKPLGYHIISLIFYALISANVGLVASLLSNNKDIGLISVVLFSVFATHAEPVLWLSGTNELIAGFFTLTSLIAFIYFKKNQHFMYFIITCVTLLLSFASKETTLFLPAMLISYDVLTKVQKNEKWNIKNTLPLLIIILLWIGFLLFRIPLGSAYDDIFVFSIPRFMLNIIFYILIGIFLLPKNYVFLESIPTWHATPFLPLAALIGSSLIIIVLAWIWYKNDINFLKVQNNMLLFGIIWGITAIIPVIFVVSERAFFIASFGVIWIMATMFVGAWQTVQAYSKLRQEGQSLLYQAIILLFVGYVGLNVCILNYRSKWFYTSGVINQQVTTQLETHLQDVPDTTKVVLLNLPNHTQYTPTFRNAFPAISHVLKYQHQFELVLDTQWKQLLPQQQEHYLDAMQQTNMIIFLYHDGIIKVFSP